MILNFLDRYRDLGLLLLRLGIGFMFVVFHGWGKITGGPERWTELGGTVGLIGIDFLPAFWGFMAALAEFGGGLLLILGFLFRPALFLLICVMAMAATMYIITGNGSPYHAIELGIVFVSLFLIGPGRYSLDEQFGSSRQRRRRRY